MIYLQILNECFFKRTTCKVKEVTITYWLIEKSKDCYGNWNVEDVFSMFYDDSEPNFSQNYDNYFDLEFLIKNIDASFSLYES